MKNIIITLLMVMGCNYSGNYATNAYFYNDSCISVNPFSSLKMHGDIVLKAKYKDEVLVKKEMKKNDYLWKTYKITYDNISLIKENWEYPEISFLCIDCIKMRDGYEAERDRSIWSFAKGEELLFELSVNKSKNNIIGLYFPKDSHHNRKVDKQKSEKAKQIEKAAKNIQNELKNKKYLTNRSSGSVPAP